MSDTLVVVSKIKKHVKDTYGLRTSEEAIQALSTMVMDACATAVKNAQQDNRKTIAARDLEPEPDVEGIAIAADLA